MKVCKNCGVDVKGKFCKQCGTPVEAAVVEQHHVAEKAVEADRIVESEPVAESERAVESEPVVETERVVESEPEVGAKRAVETESEVGAKRAVNSEQEVGAVRAVETEPEVEAERAVESEPAVETERAVESEPVAESERVAESTAVQQEKNAVRASLSTGFFLSFSVLSVWSVAIMVAASYLFAWIANRGSFTGDAIFHSLKNMLSLPLEQAAYFTSHISDGVWLQLLMLQGGFFSGQYTTHALLEKHVLEFQIHVPLIFHIVFVFFTLLLSVRVLRKIVQRYLSTLFKKWLWLIAFSALYTICMALLSMLMRPDITMLFGEQHYSLAFTYIHWKQLLTNFGVSLVAAAVGVGGWKQKHELWQACLKSLRSFFIIMTSFMLLISSLMVVNWMLLSEHKTQQSNMINLEATWSSYQTDPSFYTVLPNVLFQQLLYSTGATWEVEGHAAANVLGLQAPISLNMYTGIKGHMTEEPELNEMFEYIKPWNEQQLTALEKDIRLNWYHAAFILVFLFAIVRIRFNRLLYDVASKLSIVLFITLGSFLFSIKAIYGQVMTAFIGFNPLHVLIVGVVFVVIVSALSYIIQKLWTARRGVDA